MSDLRRRIIRLAAEAEPALKKDLLAILKDQADPVSHDQNLPEHYYGLPPKGKVAASGPAADGKNWTEKKDSKGVVRHVWTAPSNSDSAIDGFTVFEKVGPKGEKSFAMNVLMSDGEIYKRSKPEDSGRLFAMAARLFESAATPGFDLGSQPGWTKV